MPTIVTALAAIVPLAVPLVAIVKSAASTPDTDSEKMTRYVIEAADVTWDDGDCRLMLNTTGGVRSIVYNCPVLNPPFTGFPIASAMPVFNAFMSRRMVPV